MKLVTKEAIDKYQSVNQTGANNIVKDELVSDKKKDLKVVAKPTKEKLEKKTDKTLLPKKRESTKKGIGVS